MMPLPQFLQSIDQTTAQMPREDLAAFIHDIARTLPEKERDDFLKRLNEANTNDTKPIQSPQTYSRSQSQAQKQAIAQTLKALMPQLQDIQNGDLSLDGELNQDYDDWYDSADEEFLYSDPDGVLNIIEEACRFIHQCIDCEEYEAARQIAEILIGLDITIGGEYQDYTDTPMSINDLGYYHLGNIDYKTMVIDGAHAVYCASPLPERADALYRTFANSRLKDITLEMVMQSGRELPGMEDFLPLWIDYLGSLTTDNAERLLGEAVEMAGGGEQLLASARKYCGEHPELYEQYLSDSQGKTEAATLLAVGMEALDAIHKKYRVRSRVALLTGRMALELGRQEDAESCWLEAFRSDTNVVNYMRLLMECRDFSGIREETAQIYRKAYPRPGKAGAFQFPATDRKENKVMPTTAYILAFLGGEFTYVREKAMNVRDALGWSATFMKCGLAAFLLLLTEEGNLPSGIRKSHTSSTVTSTWKSGEAAQDMPESASQLMEPDGMPSEPLQPMQPGSREMLRQVMTAAGFRKAEYEKGILKVIEESDEDWFRICWLRWRETVALTEEEREELLQWTDGLIARRVQGIMEGNHRKYYGECAAYVAALGEARESAGVQNGKQRTMAKYRELYPRRSAFREELRRYGMADARKKK